MLRNTTKQKQKYSVVEITHIVYVLFPPPDILTLLVSCYTISRDSTDLLSNNRSYPHYLAC